ncbi:MAG: NAD(P)H-hydrate dehydratase [Pseudomonadales bacterium]|nr:NAD(P)H-hydrate dehydratase [Pseudomonadales bacterium]
MVGPCDAGDAPREDELVVDGLRGTGLRGEVRAQYRDAIDRINASGRPEISVDIPSGLCADTGSVLGSAVRARFTVTFIGLKRGLVTNEGPEHCGELVFTNLDVPDAVYEGVTPDADKLAWRRNVVHLPRRPRNAHKRDFGHILIVGGDRGMGGAVAMAGEAALRAGAGLVSVATHPAHAAGILSRRPELMVRPAESGADLDDLLSRVTTLIVGPGLGTGTWSRTMFERVLLADLPMVVDADGLNLLAERDISRDNWILTPHPGEASRLMDGADVRSDRYGSARQLQARYGGVVVLKGSGSLIAGPGGILVCPYGNPGMSTAGMGDVLSGVIGGILGQGLGTRESAALGVCAHALAGDRLARKSGERGLIATDLIPVVRQLLNEIS